MRRSILALLLVLALCPAGVQADEKKAEEKPAKPLTTEQAADAASAAFKVKDAPALKAFAEKDTPDPWFVADELCYRGEHDAAEAFAKAAPRVDVEKLPAYVEAWRKRRPNKTEHQLLAVMNTALRSGAPQKVIEGTATLEPRPDRVIHVRLLFLRGMALQRLRLEESEDVLRSGAEAARALGWFACATRMYHQAGLSAYARSAWARALLNWNETLALYEHRGNPAGAASTLRNIGLIHEKLGDYARAESTYERALAAKELVGDKVGAAATLRDIGIVLNSLGDYTKAKSIFERVLTEQKALGDKQGEARTLVSIANVHTVLGDYAKALALFERAMAAFEAMGDERATLATLGNIGAVHLRRGNYATALSIYERVLEQMQARGEQAIVADMLGNIGLVYAELGDRTKALAFHERALTALQALGDKAGAARVLGNIGDVHESLGDYAKALAIQENVLATQQTLGDKLGVSTTLGNIGNVHAHLGDHAKALEFHTRALTAMEALGDRAGVARTLGNIGSLHQTLGNQREARAALERSVRAARNLRAVRILVSGLTRLARAHLDAGATGRALGAAQRALTAMEDLLGGLGEEEGATAREQHTDLFAIGVLAAVRDGDLATALTFLESGRAGALLDALGNREVLRWKAESLPEDLRRAEVAAQDAQRVARHAYERARQVGHRKATRRAREVLEEATENVRAVAARIQREMKRQAGLFYPRAETIETIRDALKDDEALVLYGLCLEETLALVLRRDGERVVTLGTDKAVRAACAALDAKDATVDATDALAQLKTLLVEPLQLGKDVKHVLVSPEGPLCYLPLGALFDQPVATTPSGTTHVLLTREAGAPGAKVLALGDPDYGAELDDAAMSIYREGRLVRLPATRDEVKAVGDVILLGKDASESGMRESVAKEEHWRAVHLACHGLVKPAKPMLSSLALTRTGEDDGFLTGAEVLRMQIPADLVVLSACETATGMIVQGEGIVGLTRAFMYAGSPRVICSLWKVDDEATRALMIKFYDLWNPKDGKKAMGAAAALKQAQQFVRDFKDKSGKQKWKHPYYWAAWVLWGLPD